VWGLPSRLHFADLGSDVSIPTYDCCLILPHLTHILFLVYPYTIPLLMRVIMEERIQVYSTCQDKHPSFSICSCPHPHDPHVLHPPCVSRCVLSLGVLFAVEDCHLQLTPHVPYNPLLPPPPPGSTSLSTGTSTHSVVSSFSAAMESPTTDWSCHTDSDLHLLHVSKSCLVHAR
jgi:hypothetical protein